MVQGCHNGPLCQRERPLVQGSERAWAFSTTGKIYISIDGIEDTEGINRFAQPAPVPAPQPVLAPAVQPVLAPSVQPVLAPAVQPVPVPPFQAMPAPLAQPVPVPAAPFVHVPSAQVAPVTGAQAEPAPAARHGPAPAARPGPAPAAQAGPEPMGGPGWCSQDVNSVIAAAQTNCRDFPRQFTFDMYSGSTLMCQSLGLRG
ncbi:unnamed protein product [Closterium sp. NIES-65]|nr:unnamed protein product [Closterium sp. NIES-65]